MSEGKRLNVLDAAGISHSITVNVLIHAFALTNSDFFLIYLAKDDVKALEGHDLRKQDTLLAALKTAIGVRLTD